MLVRTGKDSEVSPVENKTSATRAEILRAAAETFGTQPEYLWQDTPSYAVLRHAEGRP